LVIMTGAQVGRIIGQRLEVKQSAQDPVARADIEQRARATLQQVNDDCVFVLA